MVVIFLELNKAPTENKWNAPKDEPDSLLDHFRPSVKDEVQVREATNIIQKPNKMK